MNMENISDTTSDTTRLSGLKRKILARLAEKDEIEHASTQVIYPRRNLGELPLSFAQQRLWFLDQFTPGSSTLNCSSAVRLQGSLHIAALSQGIVKIMGRHEALRTIFPCVDGEPIQVIREASTWSLPVVDLSQLPFALREQVAQRLATYESHRSFDLMKGPLLRITLLRLDKTSHVAFLTMHHVVSDGWSIGVFIREMVSLYETFSTGEPCLLTDLPIQYADFAVWQRQWCSGDVLETQLSYWKQQLAGAPPLLSLPIDRPRSGVMTFRGANQSFELSPKLLKSIQELNRGEGVTLFMTLLAVFQILLYFETGEEDIIVGTDVANRNRVETEGLIGFFVNQLALRTNLSGNPTFRQVLRQVRDVTLGAYAHQDLPFDKLVEVLELARSFNYSPLFQVKLVVQNAPMPPLDLKGLTFSFLEVDRGTTKYDLALFLTEPNALMKGTETEGILRGTWVYNTDLFDATTIIQMMRQFERLLGSIVTQPDEHLNTLKIQLTEVERTQQTMERLADKQSKLKMLMNTEFKTVSLSEMELIKTGYLQPEEMLPLVVQPVVDSMDLADWATSNREFIETEVLKHGAILFRGFSIDSVFMFEQFALTICCELFGEYGDLPRAEIGNKIYSSTPYPPNETILFHNESSHMNRWPLKIFFFCFNAAQQGGETPIIDCRKIYQLLDPKIRERFRQKQIMYVRNFTDNLDVSWQEFFQTMDKSEVENYCHKNCIDFEWKPDNGLRTRHVRPAVTTHPNTNEMIFFNQLQLHHVLCLDSTIRESLLSLFEERDLPRNVYYGDGAPIESTVLDEIRRVYQEASISFPWQEGDILMLDNMLIAHGRNPYVGRRKIMVALGDIINDEDNRIKKGETNARSSY